MTKWRTGPPLVFLHQTASSSAMFTRLMELLADDYWLIAPDTPGFGQSFAPQQTASMPFYAQKTCIMWSAVAKRSAN